MTSTMNPETKSQRKVSVTLGPAAVDALNEVCGGVLSHVDVMRRALALYVKVIRLLRAGGTIAFHYPDGTIRELEPMEPV